MSLIRHSKLEYEVAMLLLHAACAQMQYVNALLHKVNHPEA